MPPISNTLIAVTVLVLHLIIGWRTQVLINRSLLTVFQKRLNSILNWLIPFIWPLIVKIMIKPPANPVTIKKDRKTKMSGDGPGSVSVAE